MKNNWKCLVSLLTLVGMLTVRGDTYPSMEEARDLFSISVLTNQDISVANRLSRSSRHLLFIRSLAYQSSESESFELEDFLLTSFTSIVVSVSTNNQERSCNVNLLPDRGKVMKRLFSNFRVYPTNETACLAIAGYLRSVVPAVITGDCAVDIAGGAVRMGVSTNENDLVEFNEILNAESNIAWKIQEQRKLLQRIRYENKCVSEYRKVLFEVCNIGVQGCKETMPYDAFIQFTNQLERIALPTIEERGLLFDFTVR